MSETRYKVALITPYGTVNSGLRLLCSVLRGAGFACDTVFFGTWINNAVRMPGKREIDALIDLLAARKPDLVGLGFGSPYLAWARWVLAEVRDRLRVPTVAGGIHPTLSPEDLHGHADYICVGEGEHALLELATALRAGRDPRDIQGLHIRDSLRTKINPVRPLIENLDELPYRDFHDEGRFTLYGDRVVPGEPLRRARWLRVYASRGCPYACEYCYNSSLKAVYGERGNYHRIHSVDWTIGEVLHLRRQLPKLRRILFDDDTFIFPQSWLDEFCRRWPEEVGLPFDILAHPEALNEKKLTMLRRAGLEGAQVGIQAASEAETKELYNRKGGVEQTLAFAQLCHKLGVNVVYDVILDNPRATDTDREMMLDLLGRLPKPYRLFLYSLRVFPKTGLSGSLASPPEQIEGRSQLSLRQFRAGLTWPRTPQDRLFVALVSLASKPLIRASWLRRAWGNPRWRANPRPLEWLASVTNLLRLGVMGLKMLGRGELAWYKLREYAGPTRMLTQ